MQPSQDPSQASSVGDQNADSTALVEHFFRHESANLLAVLTRAFGVRRMELLEDCIQTAMMQAMHSWKQAGPPASPAAWIHRAAKNRVLDAIRRERTQDQALEHYSDQTSSETADQIQDWLATERIPDSLLRMIFVCCHPSLDVKSQIAVTLKTLCGFGVKEIASGLLMPAEAAKKRIQRARKVLADANVQPDLPADAEIEPRLESVHNVLYLMFNEGYSTSTGESPIRDDICEESTRLCHLLCRSNLAKPSTKALLALQIFHAARFAARTDAAGNAVLLEDQDRSKWDYHLIAQGQYWLAKSRCETVTTYHLEAAIAMQHCLAASFDETNWPLVIQFYNRLLQIANSSVYRLNCSIAKGHSGDVATALRELRQMRDENQLKGYFLVDCAIAQMHELNDAPAEAIDCYLAVLSQNLAVHQRALIQQKLHKLVDRRSQA